MNKMKALVIFLLLFSSKGIYAQKRNWSAFQIGWGIQRTQILNDGFHSLVNEGKVASAFGYNFNANYMINPIAVRTYLFTEEFVTNDPTYVYNDKITKLRGYKASFGLNIIPHTEQLLDFSCGYNYTSFGSVDASSKALTSKILQFPFWGIGFTSDPQNKLSVSVNYNHPLKLTQDNYSQIMLSILLNMN